jgi:hypothetical protein
MVLAALALGLAPHGGSADAAEPRPGFIEGGRVVASGTTSIGLPWELIQADEPNRTCYEMRTGPGRGGTCADSPYQPYKPGQPQVLRSATAAVPGGAQVEMLAVITPPDTRRVSIRWKGDAADLDYLPTSVKRPADVSEERAIFVVEGRAVDSGRMPKGYPVVRIAF